jgi:dTDP-4-dehydrorhamnose 3,5-epimerase
VRFMPTDVAGAFVIEQERHADERGYFARTWCARELADQGLEPALSQCSVSFNRRQGTLRGLHYQVPPHAEVKIVRCTRGAIYDVALDLRPDSPTFRRWMGAELSPENGRALYVPRGCAHGFYSLTDDAEVAYQIAGEYAPEAARGVRWNDPFHDVRWPGAVRVIAPRDEGYPSTSVDHLQDMRGLA